MKPKRTYYDKDISPSELAQLFDHEDYWKGLTSDWNGGIFNDAPLVKAKRCAHYLDLAIKVMERDPGSVLEVGCGIGQVLAILDKFGGIITAGIDISHWAVEHAITSPGTVEWGDVLDLSKFKTKGFGLVYSRDLLEHIPLSILPRAITECDRVGRRNYHIISCGSLSDDRDVTHVTMHRIGWWRRRVPSSWEIEAKGA